MASSKQAGNVAGGPQVASDFNNVLTTLPGFGAMLSLISYANNAQQTLRKCEYDELIEAAHEAGKILHDNPETADPTKNGEWPPEAEEIKDQVYEKFGDFPSVTENFKAFVQNARVANFAVNAHQKK